MCFRPHQGINKFNKLIIHALTDDLIDESFRPHQGINKFNYIDFDEVTADELKSVSVPIRGSINLTRMEQS